MYLETDYSKETSLSPQMRRSFVWMLMWELISNLLLSKRIFYMSPKGLVGCTDILKYRLGREWSQCRPTGFEIETLRSMFDLVGSQIMSHPCLRCIWFHRSWLYNTYLYQDRHIQSRLIVDLQRISCKQHLIQGIHHSGFRILSKTKSWSRSNNVMGRRCTQS